MAWQASDKLNGGKYTIEPEAVLGKGRFAITYLARNQQDERVVIKCLNQDSPQINSLSKEYFQRLNLKFRDEGSKLRLCKNRYIARFKDRFQEGELWCIVIEYIDGRNLAQRAQPILPEKDALNYIKQIGEALIEVHRNGWVHRDVKPANIMLRSGKSEAVLIDFDLARDFDLRLTTDTPTITEGYAPLELYERDAERGAFTDVYSLAATLYNLLTGEEPPSVQDRSRRRTQLRRPKEINPQISETVDQAIITGMALDASDRPQTMQKWLNLLGLEIPSSPPPDPSIQIARQGLWVALFVGLLGAAIALFAALPPWLERLDKSKPASQPSPQTTTTTTPDLKRTKQR
ncbi:serine/threonine protein kinase [Nostoc sp. C117]|uniref:serine/threonine protein kinase n=1 Tax=Nostoc sp. C117 TaxID=3349875 RepID=UPI00370D0DD9